jgi:hypothetical protein
MVGELHLAAHAHPAAILVPAEQSHKLLEEARVGRGRGVALVLIPQELQALRAEAASKAASGVID